ncbi:hypothetical protein SNEBB_007077 [Seison nebaliae]|nr:hypothetical protein SNEBB_007077 [Seison nebaliae]
MPTTSSVSSDEETPRVATTTPYEKTAAPKKKPKNFVYRISTRFVEHKVFQTFIFLVILVNTGLLIVETFESINIRYSYYFLIVDDIFFAVYFFEAIMKIYVYRLKYFKSIMNLLDFFIVSFSCLNIAMTITQDIMRRLSDENKEIKSVMSKDRFYIFRVFRVFRGFRALRALRVLRTIRFMRSLQIILKTMLLSIQSMLAILVLMLIFLYIFAVIGRGVFSQIDQIRFGNLYQAIFTLFQILTLDDWVFIYRDNENNGWKSAFLITFLITYLVIEYFIFLNLFVAVLVDNFQLSIDCAAKEDEEQRKKNTTELDELRAGVESASGGERAGKRSSTNININYNNISEMDAMIEKSEEESTESTKGKKPNRSIYERLPNKNENNKNENNDTLDENDQIDDGEEEKNKSEASAIKAIKDLWKSGIPHLHALKNWNENQAADRTNYLSASDGNETEQTDFGHGAALKVYSKTYAKDMLMNNAVQNLDNLLTNYAKLVYATNQQSGYNLQDVHNDNLTDLHQRAQGNIKSVLNRRKMHGEIHSEVNDETVQEAYLHHTKTTMDQCFSSNTEAERDLLGNHLMLLSSLEYHSHMLEEQHNLSRRLVQICGLETD